MFILVRTVIKFLYELLQMLKFLVMSLSISATALNYSGLEKEVSRFHLTIICFTEAIIYISDCGKTGEVLLYVVVHFRVGSMHLRSFAD